MRTLGANLTAAQQAASTEPYVAVSVENIVGSLRRLDFVQLDATANAIARHGVAVAGDGSVTRVRGDGAGALCRQRVANPAAGPWTNWTTQHTGKGNQLAVAANGTRVVIIYTDAAGTGIKYIESTDSGATYGAETAVATAAAAVLGLAVAVKNSGGDLAIAWITSGTLNIIKRTSGSFGAASGSGISVSSLNGIAMCYGADWDIALTGVEATTLRHTLWSIVYGDGYDAPANTWGALNPQQQAESNSSVAFSAPAIVYCDGYHVNYVEADTFTGGSTRVYRTTLHLFTTYAYGANTMSAPAPVNYGGAEGLALAADAGGGGYLYETAPDIVTRAPLAQSLLTLTNDVLAVAIDERGDATSGYIELDNAGGAYAGPPAPIAVGNLVNLSWGYRTGAGPQAARMADLYIAACEYRRTGGVSTLRLHVEGGWELLRRNRQRTQVAHAGAETYLQILSRILSRAGLLLSTSGVSTRASTVTPKFTIHPRTSGYEAAQQALSFLAGPRQAGAVRRRADGAAGVRREHVLVRWSARAPRGAARAGAAAREQRAGLRRGSLRRGDRLRERGGRAGHATAGARLEQQHGRGRGGDGYGAAAPAGARHTRRRARRAAELRAGSARPDRLHRHIDLNFGGETARDGHRLAVRQAARDVRTDASPGGGMTIRSTILPGVLKAWYSGSWTADVQLTGSLQLWLAGVPVARNIASVEMVTGRNIAVVIFDETNPNDAAVIAVWT